MRECRQSADSRRNGTAGRRHRSRERQAGPDLAPPANPSHAGSRCRAWPGRFRSTGSRRSRSTRTGDRGRKTIAASICRLSCCVHAPRQLLRAATAPSCDVRQSRTFDGTTASNSRISSAVPASAIVAGFGTSARSLERPSPIDVAHHDRREGQSRLQPREHGERADFGTVMPPCNTNA